jgi:hypothetical protein
MMHLRKINKPRKDYYNPRVAKSGIVFRGELLTKNNPDLMGVLLFVPVEKV